MAGQHGIFTANNCVNLIISESVFSECSLGQLILITDNRNKIEITDFVKSQSCIYRQREHTRLSALGSELSTKRRDGRPQTRRHTLWQYHNLNMFWHFCSYEKLVTLLVGFDFVAKNLFRFTRTKHRNFAKKYRYLLQTPPTTNSYKCEYFVQFSLYCFDINLADSRPSNGRAFGKMLCPSLNCLSATYVIMYCG